MTIGREQAAELQDRIAGHLGPHEEPTTYSRTVEATSMLTCIIDMDLLSAILDVCDDLCEALQ